MDNTNVHHHENIVLEADDEKIWFSIHPKETKTVTHPFSNERSLIEGIFKKEPVNY